MNLYNLRFYIVQNSEGKYLRRIGQHGYGGCWIADPTRATAYQRKSVAEARVTTLANLYPEYPVPTLLELQVGMVLTHPQTERVARRNQAALEGRKRAALREAEQRVEQAEKELEQLRARAT